MSSLAWFDPSAGIGAALHLKALFVQMSLVMMLWVELMIVLVIQSTASILCYSINTLDTIDTMMFHSFRYPM